MVCFLCRARQSGRPKAFILLDSRRLGCGRSTRVLAVLGVFLGRQLSLISPPARVDASSRGILKLSCLVQFVSSCITCCRMMTRGAIASCGAFFSLPIVYTVDRACICIVCLVGIALPRVSQQQQPLVFPRRLGVAVSGERFVAILDLSLLPLPLASAPTSLLRKGEGGLPRRVALGPVPAGEPCFVDREAVMALARPTGMRPGSRAWSAGALFTARDAGIDGSWKPGGRWFVSAGPGARLCSGTLAKNPSS